MSAANNTSKSGSKSCSSPDDYYEDELVTWLQYPLGDSMEKGYCSDLFGQWPSSSMASPVTGVGAPRTLSGGLASVGPCSFSENGSLSRSDRGPASCDSGNLEAKERVVSGSALLRGSSAEGALALGAERAAGLASLSGRDAFNKVRTSMQPPAGSQLTPISTSNACGLSSDQPFRSRSMASPGAFTSKLPPQLPQGKLNSPSKPPQPSTNYGASASSSLASASKGALSHSMSFTSYRSRSLTEAPLQMPSTQDSGCSRITEEMSVQRASDHTSSASSKGQASIALVSGVIPARFAPVDVELRNQRTPVPGRSEIAFASSSCRSLSGTTLSTREASSYSGKRKLEDSESQSEDVEGESSMDAKHPRKSSSSKRNRAAEVHNLSERNRRNRINEKLKALQDLIPNSSKTDKASVLDEAIEYMKTLQMQLQMVSMRSGLNVSPMMIPLGMPHLQMAPLHPVGLGVPIGHPGLGMGMGMGMGMGLHMSMGMGMMDMPQGGMLARPPSQSISAHNSNHFSVPFPGRSGSHECSLDSTNIGSIPSQFMPSVTQTSSQIPTPMHPGFHSLSSTYPRQQHDQWQSSGHYSEPGEHHHEQVGKEN